MKETRIVELVIDENSEELAIDAISLVAAPAIEQDFVFFGKEKNNLTFAKVDKEKRMLVSPALIPNKQIFRYDPNTDSDYYVYFSPETVRKASELYLKNNNHHKATHEHQDRVSGVLTVESWIIEDSKKDKSALYGFSLPKGTWMVKMKIENDDLWAKIKDGSLKGLSIEGYFTDKMQKMSERQPTDLEILSALNEIIRNKTELKAEKVELGAIDDLTKKTKTAIDAFNSINASARKAGQIIDKAESKASKLNKTFKDLEGDWDKVKKQAKELGVDLPSEVAALVRNSSAYENSTRNAASQLEKASSIVYGIED
jgi:hypothetical protein